MENERKSLYLKYGVDGHFVADCAKQRKPTPDKKGPKWGIQAHTKPEGTIVGVTKGTAAAEIPSNPESFS